MKLAIVGHERCPAFSDLPDAISLGTNLLARGMARRGHDVTLFSPLPPLSAPDSWPCRVEVFPGFMGADTFSFRFGACYFDWVENLVADPGQYDAIYLANRPEALSCGSFLRTRAVVAYDTPPEYTLPSYWWTFSHKPITCSDFMAERLEPLVKRTVEVVRHGFDLEVYKPTLPNTINTLRVLMAGRDIPEKGFALAANALREAYVRTSVASNCEPSMMPTRYSNFRVVVVPSIWPEPACRVAMEALLCGCAVVHSGAGGLPEIEGENTFAFNYRGDLKEMVRLVRTVLDMPEEEFRQQSAQSVTEARGRWSEERFLNDMERVFREVSER